MKAHASRDLALYVNQCRERAEAIVASLQQLASRRAAARLAARSQQASARFDSGGGWEGCGGCCAELPTRSPSSPKTITASASNASLRSVVGLRTLDALLASRPESLARWLLAFVSHRLLAVATIAEQARIHILEQNADVELLGGAELAEFNSVHVLMQHALREERTPDT